MIDFLRSLFFENVLLLLSVEVMAFAIVFAVHRRRMTAGSRGAIWITLLICVVLLVVQRLVETDREQIRAAIWTMALAIDEGDVATLGENLDRDFRDAQLDKQAWLADIRQRLQRWSIDDAKVGGFDVKVDGDKANASFWASCTWQSGQQVEHGVNSTWTLAFIHRENGWKLQRVLKATFGPGGMLSYDQIRSY